MMLWNDTLVDSILWWWYMFFIYVFNSDWWMCLMLNPSYMGGIIQSNILCHIESSIWFIGVTASSNRSVLWLVRFFRFSTMFQFASIWSDYMFSYVVMICSIPKLWVSKFILVPVYFEVLGFLRVACIYFEVGPDMCSTHKTILSAFFRCCCYSKKHLPFSIKDFLFFFLCTGKYSILDI